MNNLSKRSRDSAISGPFDLSNNLPFLLQALVKESAEGTSTSRFRGLSTRRDGNVPRRICTEAYYGADSVMALIKIVTVISEHSRPKTVFITRTVSILPLRYP